MSDTHHAIELRGVALHRDGRWILRDINWTVPAGTCAAVLGPNGSGKSTLARILACHLWPTGGQVRILGGEFGDANLIELRRDVRLLQPAGPCDMDGALSARQAVLTGFFGTLGLYDVPTAAMQAEADDALDQVGLRQVRQHAYNTLSSGEKLRCLIARALVQRPRLLILDEPTAGLDLRAREQVLATVQALFANRQTPPTVVLITHHVEELPPVTRSVLLLDEGEAAAVGEPTEVLRPEILSRVYRCAVQVRRRHGRFYLEVHPRAWSHLLHRGEPG